MLVQVNLMNSKGALSKMESGYIQEGGKGHSDTHKMRVVKIGFQVENPK